MNKRTTYWVDLDDCKLEIVGELAFEMYGSKFGIHKEIAKGKWGNYDEFIVTDIATGRRICTALDHGEAISLAKIELKERGEKSYLEAVKKILNP